MMDGEEEVDAVVHVTPLDLPILPTEILSSIFETLSHSDRIHVSRVDKRWSVIVQNCQAFSFNTTLDNDSLKHIAERNCPLNTLKIENWTDILRDDISVDVLISTVNNLKLKTGIAAYNLENIFKTSGGSVRTLAFQRSFFNFNNEARRKRRDFPENICCFKWDFLQVLKLKIPGCLDRWDVHHLRFVDMLLSNARLPMLTKLSVELGRKKGAEASRINREGRIYYNSASHLIWRIFSFIAKHHTTIQSLKLYVLVHIQPEDYWTNFDLLCPVDIQESLSLLNLKKIKLRHYDNHRFGFPLVRYLVVGATAMTHLEFEQHGYLLPEVYAAIERNTCTLKTVKLEIRVDEGVHPNHDVYEFLHHLRNCSVLETLHLRGHGYNVTNLDGVPVTVKNLRLGLRIDLLYRDDDRMSSFLNWVSVHLPRLQRLEICDPHNVQISRASSSQIRTVFRRMSSTATSFYLETNWYGDYSLVVDSAQLFST